MDDAVGLHEELLIRDLKNGSGKAFDAIYQMYAKRLFACCLQFTKTKEDAEEIVQDVFVQLWVKRESIRQTETLRSLLFVMSKNQLINAYRSRLNSPVYEDYVKYQEKVCVSDTSFNMEYEEFAGKLQAALKRLTVTQQKVIELSRLHGFSDQEVAVALSLSKQTVKNQLSTGLKALRQLLGKVFVLCWTVVFL
jgi:RNA polymerase sigma-70 factor (ECF subfamily)